MSELIPNNQDFNNVEESKNFIHICDEGEFAQEEIRRIIQDSESKQYWMAKAYWPGSWDLFSEIQFDEATIYHCEERKVTEKRFFKVGKEYDIEYVDYEDWCEENDN